jgi:hypothetical protein
MEELKLYALTIVEHLRTDNKRRSLVSLKPKTVYYPGSNEKDAQERILTDYKNSISPTIEKVEEVKTEGFQIKIIPLEKKVQTK